MLPCLASADEVEEKERKEEPYDIEKAAKEACSAPGVRIELEEEEPAAPAEPQAQDEEASKKEGEKLKDAVKKAFGKRAKAAEAKEGEPGGFTWTRGKQTSARCVERVRSLGKEWPERLRVSAYTPGLDLKKERASVDASIPADLGKAAEDSAALGRAFDRVDRDITSAGEMPTAGAAAWPTDYAPQARSYGYAGPAQYVRSYQAPPQPAASPSTVAGWVADGRDWLADRARRGINYGVDAINDVSKALGLPQAGRLVNGVALPFEGPGYKFVRYGRWGTGRLVAGIQWMGAEVKAAGGPTLQIGDMSYKNGGIIRRHKSHQNGRDVDVFVLQGPKGFDVAGNWRIVELMLTNPHFKVTNIFLDSSLKARLLQYARARGADAKVVQKAAAVISHEPGHKDHFHLRIA